MNEKDKTVSEKLFDRYEYIAKKYAGKIYSYGEISYEYEDLLQEFRLKIFQSIKSYGRRWLKYRAGEASKPVPLQYYLEAAASNKARDFIKYIKRESYKVKMDAVNMDYGVDCDSEINVSKNKFIIHGVDLLEGLSGKERSVFSLYLRGFKIALINRVYFSTPQEKKIRDDVKKTGDQPVDASYIIEMQKKKIIKKYGNDLIQSNRVYTTCNIEDNY
jgi:DNA-directed RNA polymerase specialized sigma24 family protein